MDIVTFDPALDAKDNSIVGVKTLEYLSRELHLHIFDLIASDSHFIVPSYTDNEV